ncbi:universal stress protein [Flavobacterium suncheonense]|uniref:Universal stress protein UspA n=1 Tax=Flavobacterium suncheonense GH29-5 = DSM 17707 TaxID=1121899 RepID=A0A0A2MDX9_9FLAO|nr:universal stress protein [Flavobacterium suncheonense]KGO89806.1 universal stress protein UspA [Flavobacterium suncheonense GH29-5 = DSM 17707]
MKKILVPTDFSKHAEYALKVAAQIAKKNNGEIYVLHMLELPHEANDPFHQGHDIPEIMYFKKRAEEKLDDLTKAPYLDGIDVSEIIKIEGTFEGIMDISKKNDIDLIVMGSHGASGFKEMIIGSNTEKVVRTSEIPVLVIKKEMDTFAVNKFVFASDFSDEVKGTFSKAVEFSNKFGAHLHLVSINTPNNFKSTAVAEKIMSDFIGNFQIDNYSTHIYNDVNVEKGILNFANSIDADLIGMSTHGRRGLAHFFNGSISEDLVNHAVRPVVTFKI